jgi:hypothetical protein
MQDTAFDQETSFFPTLLSSNQGTSRQKRKEKETEKRESLRKVSSSATQRLAGNLCELATSFLPRWRANLSLSSPSSHSLPFVNSHAKEYLIKRMHASERQ